jgi:hypothetical protein
LERYIHLNPLRARLVRTKPNSPSGCLSTSLRESCGGKGCATGTGHKILHRTPGVIRQCTCLACSRIHQGGGKLVQLVRRFS